MKFYRIKPDKVEPEHHEIQQVIEALKDDQLVVIPSDTVYGLACNAQSKKAVKRIFSTKRRRETNPLPIFFYSINHVKQLLELNKKEQTFLEEVWPGKVTVVLPFQNKALSEEGLSLACADLPDCGARVPDYKLIRLLISELDRPLVGTSANITGLEATGKIEEVMAQFEDKAERPDIVLDAGVLEPSKPSTVVKPEGDELEILREGAISKPEIKEIWENIDAV